MSLYDKVKAAGLPPIHKQAALVDKVFTITAVKRESFTDEATGEDRDYFIATCEVNGDKGQYYLSGTAIMPKVEVIEANQDELPATFKLIKKRTRHGQMYDLEEPGTGEAFDAEVEASG